MSAERDELESLVTLGGGHAKFTASKILVAGYRKPQQVTTKQELDALPDGTLILDSDPDVLVKRNGSWRSPDFPNDEFGPASIGLPATVLHVGGAA